MNAQVSFLDGTYTLIHIPLSLYSSLLQPILRVLLPQSQGTGGLRDSPEYELQGLTSDGQHGFLNISVTPLECSIVCHTSWAQNVFEPVLKTLPRDVAKIVSVSRESYMVLSVISAGLDAGGRVMELTSPLALAGIPIFFITTYYSDFILVPTKERENVVKSLIAKGFELSDNESNFITSAANSQKQGSGLPASSPPHEGLPLNVAELQTRIFGTLKKRNVAPSLEEALELVQCSGRETSQLANFTHQRPSISRHATGNGRRPSWADNVDTKLYTCIISALVSQPRFMSVTLAQDDPPSLLLDKNLLDIFGDSLVGDTDACLIPIFLDLKSLPLEATGIVCGVAGILVQDSQIAASSELSYLSTAQAGAVILSEEQAVRAMDILKPLLSEEN